MPEREKEDAYHFVTYLPVNGVLYELDGLRPSPIMHAACDDGDWLDEARETIEARIATYPPGSVSPPSQLASPLAALCLSLPQISLAKHNHPGYG